MKSILPLIALTLACAACAGEPSAEAALPATPPASQAAPQPAPSPSPGDVTFAGNGKTAEPASEAPREIAAPARVPAPPAPATSPLEARRITPEELRPLLDRGEAILVDVRGESDWSFYRATEAIHIPYGELQARSAELPHEPLIALYCT